MFSLAHDQSGTEQCSVCSCRIGRISIEMHFPCSAGVAFIARERGRAANATDACPAPPHQAVS